MITPGETIGIWIAAGLTLMMFSFIYKDNVFFRFGEHLYLGLSIGYYISVQYWGLLYPEVIRRVSIDHNPWVLIPVILGFFVLLRLVPSLAWLSRWTFAFYLGGVAGYSIPNVIHNLLLKQISGTMRPLNGDPASLADLPADINQVILLVGVLSVLVFFFFSIEHKKAIGAVSKSGLYFLMVGFGAAFGSTVMARISLLIGRFQFLVYEWGGSVATSWANLFGRGGA
ncbi:MAG: hypothetical protein M3R04_04340 [bacterium]|nr:hypothetical protein [bacterium]